MDLYRNAVIPKEMKWVNVLSLYNDILNWGRHFELG